jgi:hypothetical protein
MCIFALDCLPINATTQFYPRDVVTTTAEHIIVSDYNTHALHVLSGQGDILTCKVMEDNGYYLMSCQQELCLCYYLL